jgi:hypothetical protein
MPVLTFDEASHSYHVDGVYVPSVTTILKPLSQYGQVNPAVLAKAAELGTMVHAATELYDLGTLDEDDLDPVLRPYLDAWIRFRKEVDFQPVTVEKRLYHATFGYCGTSDRTGIVRGKMAVVDIKKMLTLGPTIGPQLAAYQEAHNREGAGITRRYALGLRRDGTYRLQEYTDPSDLPCFMSLLTIYKAEQTVANWRKKHGL